MKIPKCMSTQHPDNVNIPFFSDSSEISGGEEIEEAYYVFSHLGCDEQMWDCEGKEVDNFVIKKLSAQYTSFFKENKLGRDVFITLRIPNPEEEKTEAKIVLETLESIPRSYDAAKTMYDEDIAPIFEVILPMTKSAESLNRIYKYYRDFVIGKEEIKFEGEEVKISDWIGDFNPKMINVIPLFEDKEHLLNAGEITKKYLKDKKVEYQRIFLARSDPALNYGLISAVMLNKIALKRLYEASKEIGIPFYPIIGVGSSPFRGNLSPENVENVLKEYPSVHTFTIQSAFKYDNHPKEAMEGIEKIRNSSTSSPLNLNEKHILKIIEKYSNEYRRQVQKLAPVINRISKHVPKRRKRKLHVGLFGYSRSMEGITLPRAIKFTASLYSVGIPPSLLGLNALDNEDISFLKENYIGFERDIRKAFEYFNPESPFTPEELKSTLKNLYSEVNINRNSVEITNEIIKQIESDNHGSNLQKLIIAAGNLRKFLG